jgi:hypothetical protein
MVPTIEDYGSRDSPEQYMEEYGKVLCMGLRATFDERCETTFGALLARVATELAAPPARRRLSEIQHLLCELVEQLDAAHIRYATRPPISSGLERGRLRTPRRSTIQISAHAAPSVPAMERKSLDTCSIARRMLKERIDCGRP